jgi:drug/metabolite transporter (DMT)-like permease
VWVLLCLLTALCQAVKDMILKRSLVRVDPLAAVWSYCLATSLFLFLGVLVEGVPALTPAFWTTLAVTGPFSALTMTYYVKALEASDISLSAPMLVTTPLFLLVTSPLMLGEFPDKGGLLGVLSIVAGSYVLNLHLFRNGPFEPFLALMRERGPRCMLLVAFLWSISANLDKIGLRGSSPLFWIASAFGASTICLTPLAWRSAGRGFSRALASPWLLTAGALEAVSSLSQMLALTMTIVPYVISVKRLSAVMVVLMGGMILREENMRERLAGSALMVLGVFLMAFLG